MSCLDVKKTMKLKELKELTQVKLLKIYGIEESRSIFHLLLNEFLGIDVINFHINCDKKISLDSLNLFNEKISLIEKEIPVQYVIGHVMIEGLKIFVNKSVLIPRPETVDLCNWIIQKKLNDQVILDEIFLALEMNLIDKDELISTLENRFITGDVILTGTSVPNNFLLMADQITELRS